MRARPSEIFFLVVLTLAIFLGCVIGAAASDQLATLYSFTGRADGYEPSSGLVRDAAGNLYGVTFFGGSCAHPKGCGTVFELSPDGNGGWTETAIHQFAAGSDGEWPSGTLIMDESGNLYGTAFNGGAYNNGIAYRLSPTASGWTEEILYNFGATSVDGRGPGGSLLRDAAGNLYGTTILGGTNGIGGTVFELSPTASGTWTESVLYNFSDGSDGGWPYASLVMDAAGNLYGAASLGGIVNSNCSSGCGTIYRLSPSASGWTYSVLFAFSGNNGQEPMSAVTLDAAGNLYGTTQYGGGRCAIAIGCGVVFKLSPTLHGGWKQTLLHDFTNGSDSGSPTPSVIFDDAGNIYGVAKGMQGYAISTVFEISPTSSGGWKFHVLYTFGLGRIADSPLLRDEAGNLFGSAAAGGVRSFGSVYELSPPLQTK